MKQEIDNTLRDIINLMTTSIDEAWVIDALHFVDAAYRPETSTQGYVALCQNSDGTSQSWRNMAYRPKEVEHELRLPSDYVDPVITAPVSRGALLSYPHPTVGEVARC